MDERLERALEYANFKTSLNTQKENLKIEMENLLHFAHAGGIFKIDRELLCFLDILEKKGIEEVVLIDSRENPVKILNVPDFYDDVMSRYFEATNKYHTEYDKIKKARSVKQSIGLSDDK
jgi:hypothetical protein